MVRLDWESHFLFKKKLFEDTCFIYQEGRESVCVFSSRVFSFPFFVLRERERERESVCVCVFFFFVLRGRERACVFSFSTLCRERERERERESVCAVFYFTQRERERARVCFLCTEGERESACVFSLY